MANFNSFNKADNALNILLFKYAFWPLRKSVVMSCKEEARLLTTLLVNRISVLFVNGREFRVLIESFCILS